MELTKIELSPEVVDPEDVEMLSDLVIAAANEALRAAKRKKRKKWSQFRADLTFPECFNYGSV